jgi:hypothetical protein
MKNLDSTLITISNEGIVRCFNFLLPVLSHIFPTNKQNLQYLEILGIQMSEKESLTPVLLLSSGDEDLLLCNLILSPLNFDPICIFKRNSYARVIDMVLIHNKYLLLLLDSSQVEIIQILDHAQVVKKFKRKKQRNVKNLPELPEYLRQAKNYFLTKKTIKFDSSVKSLKVDLKKTKSKKSHNIYLFSKKNYYLKADLIISENEEGIKNVKKISNFGHENALRYITLSSDDSLIFSGSKEACYLWESDDCTMLKKLHIENTNCAFFLPKNKHLVIGDNSGKMWLIEVSTGSTLCLLDLLGKLLYIKIKR